MAKRKPDVLNDDDFEGNDDHIDALKDEVVSLRAKLESPKFKDIPVGTIFQTRDIRVAEVFKTVVLVKVSEHECCRMIVSPIKMPAVSGDAAIPNACPVREIVTANLRIDGTQYGGAPMRKSSKPRLQGETDLEFINRNGRYLTLEDDLSTPAGIKRAARMVRDRMLEDK